jgi:hypothetical protein
MSTHYNLRSKYFQPNAVLSPLISGDSDSDSEQATSKKVIFQPQEMDDKPSYMGPDVAAALKENIDDFLTDVPDRQDFGEEIQLRDREIEHLRSILSDMKKKEERNRRDLKAQFIENTQLEHEKSVLKERVRSLSREHTPIPANRFNSNFSQSVDTLNPAAAAFRPESFNGKRPETARLWWDKFMNYLALAQPSERQKCSLLRMQLAGEAETWFFTLDDRTQNDFGLLEIAFEQYYIIPSQNRSKQISDLRHRFQGPNEPVRSFITDVCAKLSVIKFPRQFWLDIILPGIRPEIQTMLTALGTPKSIDEFITQAERIELAVSKPRLHTTSATEIFTAPATLNTFNETKLASAIDKLQKQTDDMVKKINNISVSGNYTANKSTSRQPSSQQTRARNNKNQQQPGVCYVCGQPGHYAARCFTKQWPHYNNFSGYNNNGFYQGFRQPQRFQQRQRAPKPYNGQFGGQGQRFPQNFQYGYPTQPPYGQFMPPSGPRMPYQGHQGN